MKLVAVEEAELNLDELIDQALLGEVPLMDRGEKPAIQLVPIKPVSDTRSIGLYKDEAFELGPEFFEPLSDDELEAWGQ